jgi:LPS-assembly lipoprotein
MSWCRRGLLAALIATLAGCGFRPLYAPRGPRDWDPALAAIVIAPIADRQGQVLELALHQNLNPYGLSVRPRWRLATNLTLSRADFGIQRNATTTISEITASASYTLREIATGKLVYASSSRTNGDFNQLVDAYATQVAEGNTRERAVTQLADEIALRLVLFVRQAPSPTTASGSQ